MKMVMRPAESPVLCPICDQAARVVRSIEFSRRGSLPTQIGIHVCKSCSFGFNFPRPWEPYDQYYSDHQNDQLGQNWQISESERNRYEDQISVLHKYLSGGRTLRVLDFGCGQGGLLETMTLKYKLHSYYGCEANAQKRITNDGVSIHRDLNDLTVPFDVIVLSHVVEHLIDFAVLERVSKLLSQAGIVYIEVPNAGAYEAYLRREFLYYFDRLHVNHFTHPALQKIADAFSLVPLEFCDQVFGYEDDGLFPAIYGVFSKGIAPQVGATAVDLNVSFCRYIEAENARLTPTYAALQGGGREVIAYGFGDNFFRSFGEGGPLEGISLAAVVDQRSSELAKGEYRKSFQFLDSEAASVRFPLATWVVTVSWGGEAIAEKLKSLGVQPSRILLL
jgi:SAM-dependent methyltransferase